MQGAVVREDDTREMSESQASQPPCTSAQAHQCAELSADKDGFAEPPSSHLTADPTTMPEPSSQAAAVEVSPR